MRLAFHYRMPFTRQATLLNAVMAGALLHDDVVLPAPEGAINVQAKVDGLVMFGIGGHSRSVYDAYLNAGKKVVFFDKGYARGGIYRVSVNSFQPLHYFQKEPRPRDRWDKLGLELKPYADEGDSILFDGASNKYCIWMGFPEWAVWGEETVAQIRRYSTLPIIYRPRPSHNNPICVAPYGTELSFLTLAEDFARARVVVSYGGNIGWDSVLGGKPHFAIGESIARPLSETDWEKIDEPHVPTEEARLQWASDVAYSQWHESEIKDGTAWKEIRKVW